MRTKTLALSAVIGMLGGAAAMAQNVYSVNTVGYINVQVPAGWSIITCPLIIGNDAANGNPTVTNDLNVVFPDQATGTYPNGEFFECTIWQFENGHSFTASDFGSYGGGWANGGADVTALPGQAVFVGNPAALNSAPLTLTWVGTVPSGSLTNTLVPGFNLVGSIVPVSGDLVTNTISSFNSFPVTADYVWFFDPAVVSGHQVGYVSQDVYSYGSWSANGNTPYYNSADNDDPTLPTPYTGFWYANINYHTQGNEKWVETFSANP